MRPKIRSHLAAPDRRGDSFSIRLNLIALRLKPLVAPTSSSAPERSADLGVSSGPSAARPYISCRPEVRCYDFISEASSSFMRASHSWDIFLYYCPDFFQ